MTLGLGMQHLGSGAHQVCSNDDPRLTLMHLNGKIYEKMIFFKTVEAKVIILT